MEEADSGVRQMDEQVGILDAGVLDVDCSRVCVWHDQVLHEDLLLDALPHQQAYALWMDLQLQDATL